MINLTSVRANLQRFTVTILVLLGSVSAQFCVAGSPGIIDLSADYGITEANGSLPVAEVLMGPDVVKATFPIWYAQWAKDGHAEAELMRLSYLVCAWNDAVARLQLKDPAFQGKGQVHIPTGRYLVNYPLHLVSGMFQGIDTGEKIATTLVMDQQHWMGDEARLLEALPAVIKDDDNDIEVSGLALESGIENGPSTGIWIDAPDIQVHFSHLSFKGFGTQAVLLAEVGNAGFSNVKFRSNTSAVSMLGCNGPELMFTNIAATDNGTLFRLGAWGNVTPHGRILGGAITIANSVLPLKDSPHDRLVDADGSVDIDLEHVTLYFIGLAPTPLCEVRNSTADSRISITGLRSMGGLRTIVKDGTTGRTYPRTDPRAHAPFNICWTPGLPEGPLPENCNGSLAANGSGSAGSEHAGHPEGTLRSGSAGISIGAETGAVLPSLEHGYNCSSLFSVSAGSDTSLQNAVSQLAPKILRFPGGTLANFYHPSGLGYGVKASDLVAVQGTSVYDNMEQSYLGEQADIAAGTVSGNYIQDIIDLATATNSSVLYVANLFSGTVAEMAGALHALVNAGVTIAGVELGNESHLSAYQSRFGSVQNYLTVAGPYAQAISAQFPGVKIGLDGYPPGILKDLGPGGTQHALDWNVAVSDASFGDALIIHCYSRPTACSQTGIVPNFVCGADFSQTYANAKLPVALDELAGLGSKSIWITEWNIDGDYSHYGNSVSQAMFYADMSLTMAEQPKVLMSACHNLMSWDTGYNIIKKGGQGDSPQINFYSSLLMNDLYLPGNKMQESTADGLDNVRTLAFLTSDGTKQHLYLLNRSGVAQDLSGFDGTATNVSMSALGGIDIAAGTGPNAARPSGDESTVLSTISDIHQVTLPPYGVVHLSWTPAPAQSAEAPVWKTTFSGTDGCRLVANAGSDVIQANLGKCATIGSGSISTSSTSSFIASITVKKVMLLGVTFAQTTNGKWINGRAKFMGGSGQIEDPFTGQVLATVMAGTYYPQLTLEFTQPVPLTSLIGRSNGASGTALMTIEAMRLFP